MNLIKEVRHHDEFYWHKSHMPHPMIQKYLAIRLGELFGIYHKLWQVDRPKSNTVSEPNKFGQNSLQKYLAYNEFI